MREDMFVTKFPILSAPFLSPSLPPRIWGGGIWEGLLLYLKMTPHNHPPYTYLRGLYKGAKVQVYLCYVFRFGGRWSEDVPLCVTPVLPDI